MKLCPIRCHKLATLMPEKFPYLSITVVLLTTGEALLPHKDVQNHRLFRNITTSFGDWTGGVLQIDENGEWIDHDSRDSWVVLDARTTRHQVTMVHGTRISITYHTDDWNQLREAGFPVDRVGNKGCHCPIQERTDLTFSSSLMNVRQQSQASEVETHEDVLQSLQVDHNLLLRPTLQAMCWLADIVLSLDGTLQLEMASKPTFNIHAIDSMIQEMQLQPNELKSNVTRLSCYCLCPRVA